MTAKFDLKVLVILGLIGGACGEEDKPADDGDGQEEEGTPRNDGGNGGRNDARVDEGDDEDSGSDEQETDEDAGARNDGGRNDGGNGGGGDAGAGGGDCDELTYESFGADFFDKYCVSCHDGDTRDPDFTRLANITEYKDDIRTRVLVTSTPAALKMPPKSEEQPTAAEKTKLDQWIECGAE